MWRQPPSAVWPSQARLGFAGSSTEPNFADRESFYYKPGRESPLTTKDTKSHEGGTDNQCFLRDPSCPSWFKLLAESLESPRPFRRHAEGPFQRDPRRTQRAFVEQAAD